jgi:hypothetical protein
MARAKHAAPVSGEQITQSILVLRCHKVVLDEDLVTLYGVATGALVQAVKRNIARFPEDFKFQLTAAEWVVLRSWIVIPTSGRGGRRFAPYLITEQGVAMLSSVLGSERAIAINIEIMRAFAIGFTADLERVVVLVMVSTAGCVVCALILSNSREGNPRALLSKLIQDCQCRR